MFRWAQVTEELKQALSEVEEEKEKRKRVEEEMNLKAQEQDNLKNKFSALMEEREKETEVMLGKEAAEKLAPETSQSEQADKVVGEPENEAALQSLQKQQVLLVSSLQDMKQKGDCAKQSQELRDVSQRQTLQVSLNNKVCVNSSVRM